MSSSATSINPQPVRSDGGNSNGVPSNGKLDYPVLHFGEILFDLNNAIESVGAVPIRDERAAAFGLVLLTCLHTCTIRCSDEVTVTLHMMVRDESEITLAACVPGGDHRPAIQFTAITMPNTFGITTFALPHDEPNWPMPTAKFTGGRLEFVMTGEPLVIRFGDHKGSSE